MKVFFFGWPGRIGGADTKLDHLLPLLRREFELIVVPPAAGCLEDDYGRQRLEGLSIPFALWHELPSRLTGWAVALCNGVFLSSGMASDARRRGLRVAWSNEMMWLFSSERGALALGLCDAVLYVSEAQRRVLEPLYQRILSGGAALLPFEGRTGEVEGWIRSPGTGRKLRWVMVGNYINPTAFPYPERIPAKSTARPLVVGRLSRADPAKFPSDFPQFYEGLGLRHARFRVMAWSARLAAQWPQHRFGSRWDLLPPLAEPASTFLQSLDLFVYSLHPSCRESWGRAVVEAMLSGVVPLVPGDQEQHWHTLVTHGETGFICADTAAFGRYARLLEAQPQLRWQMSRQACVAAQKQLCNEEQHLQAWRRLII